MIAPNPIAADDTESEALDLETRVDISITFSSYANAEREFNYASRRFTEACKELRQKLPPG